MSEINFNVEPDESNALVMLSAESWCAPCRQFAPTFKKAAEDHEGDVNFYKVDIDDMPEIASKYNVMSVPTILRIVDGKIEPITERKPIAFLNYVSAL